MYVRVMEERVKGDEYLGEMVDGRYMI